MVLARNPSAEFVAAMEDVLDVYHRPYDPECPVVCMDEASKQLIAEVRQPLPAQPGRTAKYDSEYERRGTANFFMAVEPPIADGLREGGEGRACDGQLEYAWNRQPVRGF